MLSQDEGRGVDAECLEEATDVQLDKELPEEKVDPPDKVFSPMDEVFRSNDIRCKTTARESGPTCLTKICARDGRGDSCGKHYCPRVKIKKKWTLLVNGEQIEIEIEIDRAVQCLENRLPPT